MWVQNHETLFTISESEGVKLSELYKKNLLNQGEEPSVGEKIFLKKKRDSPPELQKPESSISQLQLILAHFKILCRSNR